MHRISKENYYLDIAETVLERATCLRRIYGAIIVKNDEIISTGYNGAPRSRHRSSFRKQAMCRRCWWASIAAPYTTPPPSST